MSIYKSFERDDIVSVRQLINEAIAITGSVVSGTYSDENVKNFSHGMFQSIYDYPVLSSSANSICQVFVGYSANSDLSSSTNVQNAKKINLYNQFAQKLVGHDIDGTIREFDQDGDVLAGGSKLRECVFVTFDRLLVKDELKKGNFNFKLYTGGAMTGALSSSTSIVDSDATSTFLVNSPSGEYAVLSASNGFISQSSGHLVGDKVGLIYYQAGIAVLTASLFNITGSTSGDQNTQDYGTFLSSSDMNAVLTGTTIQHAADSLRGRWNDLDFNNTVEVNSRIYMCRVGSNDFNYSANPTYTDSSKIRVKEVSTDEPVAYITTIGLHAPDGALLAVAKLSEPIKKTPSVPLSLRTRLDY